MIAEVHSFYTNLYTAEPTNATAQQKIFNEHPIPTLPPESRNACDAPLQSEELHNALKKMENNKSPGVDGLTTNFYKHFWSIMGPHITSVFNFALSHGELSRSQCRGVITLVFKKATVQF